MVETGECGGKESAHIRMQRHFSLGLNVSQHIENLTWELQFNCQLMDQWEEVTFF